MKKCMYKEPIEANQYQNGMETGWEVRFKGYMGLIWYKQFKLRNEAEIFIKNNDGVAITGTNDLIKYYNPNPYILDKNSMAHSIINKDDFIVQYPTGRIEILSRKEFKDTFEEINN